MSHACACRALERLLDDPRLRVLPLAARGFLVVLVHAMQRLPDPGVLAWGGVVATAREIALLVSATETEVETHLETLLQTGLLTRGETGVVGVPGVATAAPGGRKGVGGRPKRGETEAEYANRQREMRLVRVVRDTGSETRETRAETPRVRVAASCLVEAKAEAKQAAGPVPDFAELGAELADIADLDHARGAFDFAVVKTWLAAGATPELLRDVVAQVAVRPSYRGAHVQRGLHYFTPMVTAALGAARAVPSPVAPAPDPADRAAWATFATEMQAWHAHGSVGPMPVRPACALRGAA